MKFKEISCEASTTAGCDGHGLKTCEECIRDMNEAIEKMNGDFYVTPIGSLQILCFGNWDKCFEFQVDFFGDSTMHTAKDYKKKWESQNFVLALGGPTSIAQGSLQEMETLLIETILGYAEWTHEGENISKEMTRIAVEGDLYVMSETEFDSL